MRKFLYFLSFIIVTGCFCSFKKPNDIFFNDLGLSKSYRATINQYIQRLKEDAIAKEKYEVAQKKVNAWLDKIIESIQNEKIDIVMPKDIKVNIQDFINYAQNKMEIEEKDRKKQYAEEIQSYISEEIRDYCTNPRPMPKKNLKSFIEKLKWINFNQTTESTFPKFQFVNNNFKKWALLISVNEYLESEDLKTLSAPVKDMDKLAFLLNEKYEFACENIFRLHGSKATRKNILDSLDKLVEYTKNIDEDFVVVIGYSGHGSYTNDLSKDELDNLDETICPYDRAEEGDIVDDTIYDYLTKILQNPKSHVHFLIDACHSGTVAKGMLDKGDEVIYKELSPSNKNNGPTTGGDKGYLSGNLSNNPRFVSYTAAASYEQAQERKFGDQGKFSLFSYFLLQTLDTLFLEENCWGDIEMRVLNGVRSKTESQTPIIIGNRKLEIFGTKTIERSNSFRVKYISEDQKKMTISGGILHNILDGTIVTIHPNKEQTTDENSIATYEVIEAQNRTAIAKLLTKGELVEIKVDDQVMIRVLGGKSLNYSVDMDVNLPSKLKKAISSKVEKDKTLTFSKKNNLTFKISKYSELIVINGGPVEYKIENGLDVTEENLRKTLDSINNYIYKSIHWYQTLNVKNLNDESKKLDLEIELITSKKYRRDPEDKETYYLCKDDKIGISYKNISHYLSNLCDKEEGDNPDPNKVFVNVLLLNFKGEIIKIDKVERGDPLNFNSKGKTHILISELLEKDNLGQDQTPFLRKEYFKIFITTRPFDAHTYTQSGIIKPGIENSSLWDLKSQMLGQKTKQIVDFSTCVDLWRTITIPFIVTDCNDN